MIRRIKPFWLHVHRLSKDECWNYLGLLDSAGYGRFTVNGKAEGAHRISYELTHGYVPDGMHVLHKCDNPTCVNPNHLFAGTALDNMQDKCRKGRHHNNKKTHCRHGHEYSKENTDYQPNMLAKGKKWRVCKECSKIRGEQWRKDHPYVSKKNS